MSPVLNTILGRTPDAENRFESIPSQSEDTDGIDKSLVETLIYKNRLKETMVVSAIKVNDAKGTIYLGSQDGSKIFTPGHSQHQLVKKLYSAGYSLVTSDSIFLNEKTTREARQVKNNRSTAIFTHGYNSPQIIRRVHSNPMSAFGVVEDLDLSENFFAISLDPSSAAELAIALSSRAQFDLPPLQGVSLWVDGFRFSNIERLNDPDLLPGAGRYFDIEGLLMLLDSTPLLVRGENETSVPKLWQHHKATQSDLRLVSQEKLNADFLLEWLESLRKND